MKIINFILSAAIGFWLVMFLTKNADYVPLIMSIVSFFLFQIITKEIRKTFDNNKF